MSPGRVLHSIVPHNAEDSIPSAFLPTHQLSTVTSLSEIRSPNLLVYRRRKLSQPDSLAVSSSAETAPHCPKALSVALVYQRRNLSQPDSAAVFSSAESESLAGTRRRGNTSLSAGICPNAISHVYKRRRKLSQRAISSAAPLTGTRKVENTSLSAACSPNALVYKRRRKLPRPDTAAFSADALETTRQRRHYSFLTGLVYKRRKLSQRCSLLTGLVYKRRRKLSQGHTRASHSEGTAHSVHESCSSSRSNVDFISASNNKEVDDTGECSSSAVPPSETLGKGASERDICISILVRHGVIKRVWPSSTRTHRGVRIGGHGCKLCNVCSRSDSTGRMLICDDCEEAFHLSCCSPRIKAIPVDEWLCHICLRKNRKAVKETSKCHNISDGAVGSLKAVSGSGASPIELMLTDTEPYTTGVRVGKGFQAEVPDWSGPAL
ncbi:PHD and RING finger domain-containing protein 1 [Linum grandiflorum]